MSTKLTKLLLLCLSYTVKRILLSPILHFKFSTFPWAQFHFTWYQECLYELWLFLWLLASVCLLWNIVSRKRNEQRVNYWDKHLFKHVNSEKETLFVSISEINYVTGSCAINVNIEGTLWSWLYGSWIDQSLIDPV
jgi:hypothetical protein